MTTINPLLKFKETQKKLAIKIRKDHDDWDSVTFRHQHIAYCEVRGRTRNQIEIPDKDNKPDQKWIDKIKSELQEKIEEWRTKE